MEMQIWYASLVKPWFAPPAELFGPVWTLLYIIIAISFGYVLFQIIAKRIPKEVGIPFALNLILNLSYSPIAFGLNNLIASSVVILLVLASIVWMVRTIWPYSRWVAYAQIPYFAWVLFATVLQLSITYLTLTAPAG